MTGGAASPARAFTVRVVVMVFAAVSILAVTTLAATALISAGSSRAPARAPMAARAPSPTGRGTPRAFAACPGGSCSSAPP